MEKSIKTLNTEVKNLKFGFGNPRKITKEKKLELKKSIEENGDFGCFVIDENYNVIGGNQRAKIMQELDPEKVVLCKMMIGYSRSELKAINIKDNTHSGEWDLEALADWTADMNIDLGFDIEDKEVEGRRIDEMELIHYEKYDYVILACKDSLSYEQLQKSLGIDEKKVVIGDKNHKSIKARAIWFDKDKFTITRKG